MPENERFLSEEEIKKQLNQEGFEANEEGHGAAIIFGKKGPEMDKLRENIETNGVAANLETYLRLNKTVCLPYDELTANPKDSKEVLIAKSNLKPKLEKNIGLTWGISEGNEYGIRYVDNKMNIAEIFLDETKIATLANIKNEQERIDARLGELRKLGFRLMSDEEKKLPGKEGNDLHWDYIRFINDAGDLAEAYKKKLEQKSQEQQKAEFDF